MQFAQFCMKISDLVFIGIKGSVVALNRHTGEQVWATSLKGLGFVNVILEHDSLLASCCGEMFCLDPLTGDGRWHNRLKGFGRGLATIATEQNGAANPVVLAEKLRREEESSAAAAAAAA